MFIALLALLALAAIGIATLSSTPANAASAEAAVAEGRLFKIIAPRDDALMRGDRVQVKLALGEGVSLRHAHLNGKSVKRLFSSRRSGTRQVATLSKARLGKLLPLGRNFLRFVVRRGGHGGEKDYETVAFTRVQSTPQLIGRFKVKFDRSRGAKVTLVPSTLSAQMRVKLNGVNVSRQFRDGTPLKRAVLLGASDGLKHGRNRLRVRAHSHHGEFEKLRKNFNLGRRPTIAGAGPDRSILAGQSATLNGKVSREAPSQSGKPKDGGLRYRWKLTGRPKGSEARLTGRSDRRPQIHTDLPGTYTAKLRTSHHVSGGAATGARRATSSLDVVEVTADAQPRPAVSTFASAGGKSGISVDVSRDCEGAVAGTKPPCFHPNPGSDSDLQVVVLDRSTLAPESNKAYKTNDLKAFNAAMQTLQTPQKGKCPAYDDDKLVLIALRSGSGILDLNEFAQGVSIFNTHDSPAAKAGCPDPVASPTAAPFSLIAVPGTLAGKAWTNAGLQINGPDGTPGTKGSLDGFLKRTADDPAKVASTRAFTFPTAIAYDTRRIPGTTEFVVGDDAVPILPGSQPADAAGLSVFSFDPVNPKGSLTREAFVSHSGGATTGLAWSQLDTTLAALSKAGKGIGITSNGQIGGYASEPQASSFGSVLSRLEGLGANADTLARAVNQADHKGTYSMIAVDGSAYQSSSAMAAGAGDKGGDLPVNEGRLTGTMQRGADARVYPSDGDPSGIEEGTGLLPIVYGDQVDWLLTPKPEAAAASCQALAFAFIATQVDGLFPGGVPTLWSNPSSNACQGRDHTGTSGVRRADTLGGDACATSDPAATGAVGENVRGASMTLRRAYQSLNTTFSQAQVQGVTRPADAPFVDADLTCAKNQMIDELAARDQVMKFMDILQKPQNDLQGQTVVNLGQIAENIKTGALAKISKRLKDQASATPSFWASLAFGTLSGVSGVATFFAPDKTILKSAFQFMNVSSKGGQSIFNAIDGRSGNPVALTNEYILLAAQLDQEAQEIEVQIGHVLTAQQNGVLQTEEIVLADPHMLAEMNAKAKGEWQVTATALATAQEAYSYRVTQLAYQAFWPQLYSGYRVGYNFSCQRTRNGPLLCFDPRATRDPAVAGWFSPDGNVKRPYQPQSLASASPVYCAVTAPGGVGSVIGSPYFKGADPGTPVGLGQGNEYHPQTAVVAGEGSPPYEVYVMAERDTPTSVADAGTVAPFFAQPSKPGDNAAGFYAPLFWQQNLDLTKSVQCKEYRNPPSKAPLVVGTPGGIYSKISATDIWPTPPK